MAAVGQIQAGGERSGPMPARRIGLKRCLRVIDCPTTRLKAVRFLGRLKRQNQHADGDQRNPEPLLSVRALAEKGEGKYGDQHQAKLIDWRDLGGVANLERAKNNRPKRHR